MTETRPKTDLRLIGENDVRLWGSTPRVRMARLAASKGLPFEDETAGSSLLVAASHSFDPLWIDVMRDRPRTVLTLAGVPVMAHVDAGVRDAAARMMAASEIPGHLEILPWEDAGQVYNKFLRKVERPYLLPLTRQTVPEIERLSYFGAYKGVTDILTKYLWPEWALALTRIAARLGVTPNMVTGVGGLLCLAATIAFWFGHYWSGMAMGLGFMVLDTVDGKLARCTITSSKWGNVFDHGIDLIHPPFWWYAWGVGLGAWGLALDPATFAAAMGVIVIGYVAQRLIEGVFIKRYGMDIHVWEKVDSDFRLITARRNPNMVILFVSMLAGRPDIGLLAVAGWTALSCVFHAVRLVQAMSRDARGDRITSWLETA